MNLTKEVEWNAEVDTEEGKFKLNWNLEKLKVHSHKRNLNGGMLIIEGLGAADVNKLADAMKNMVTMGDVRFPPAKA